MIYELEFHKEYEMKQILDKNFPKLFFGYYYLNKIKN